MSKQRLDRGTIVGLLLAISGVVAGLVLDGGSVRQVLQPSAALIVVAGTLGAIFIQFPMEVLLETCKLLPCVLFKRGPAFAVALEEMIAYCVQARRHGIMRLESQLADIPEPFIRKALTFAVDGALTRVMRENMEMELELTDEREYTMVKVLEAAGGYAPTLGIMGAVLGLIQVMQRMDNVAEIGKGIAVAFVSTLYGLGLANLLFLPLAGKLRIRLREKQLLREMTIEAVASIMEGLGPRALREKLECYVVERAAEAAEIAQAELISQ